MASDYYGRSYLMGSYKLIINLIGILRREVLLFITIIENRYINKKECSWGIIEIEFKKETLDDYDW